ncbi:hypothetical protein PG994_004178 [Apiospora phragmitis]|uniref:Uncharacterized protein n=1 Tax=Apiospora phragmitis TaxID=2905665 RepID=A0ABR1VTQ9_9PEZI
MTDPGKCWPGGIPDHIRSHPEPIKENIKEEIKGWQLFLEENAVGRADHEHPEELDESFEVTQRRRLVSRWASMAQAERDGYQSRAPVHELRRWWWYPHEKLDGPDLGKNGFSHLYRHTKGAEHKFVVCNAAAGPELSPRDMALWAKQRILCFRLDGDDTTTFGELDDDGVGVAIPNCTNTAEGGSPVEPHEFLRWAYLEGADFFGMAMTSRGTVVFQVRDPILFADREALDTGPMLLCSLENNGQVGFSGRTWAAEALYERGRTHEEDRRNMEEMGILELLESFNRYSVGGAPDVWLDYIERYAPGYLDLEEAGTGIAYGYDHSLFRNNERLEQIPFEDFEL